MAQQSASCPKCGTLATAGQRFCSNCGASLDISANKQTEYVTGEETQQAIQPAEASYAPAPPLAQTYQTPPPPPVYSAPPYAKPQKDSSKGVLGQIGCGVGVVILLVLALCGIGSYFVYNGLRGLATNTPDTNQAGSNVGSGGATNPDVTPTPRTPTVVSINGKIMYAGVNITIVDTKQTNFFTDDTSTGNQTGGIVRVSFKEENQMNRSGSFLYSDIMRLLLPDGTIVVPGNEQYPIGPDAATTRNNWADFPIPLSVKSDQLTLRIGTTTEAQMDIPLKANADISKYQPKKVTPNKQAQYVGMSWTITDATNQLGYNGKQADKGMTFVIVSLKVDNTSSKDFNGYSGDYVRLRTGGTVASPDGGCTLPLSIQTGQTNVTGTCAFLVPQGNTDYTFQLLANTSTGATTDAAIPFQIQ